MGEDSGCLWEGPKQGAVRVPPGHSQSNRLDPMRAQSFRVHVTKDYLKFSIRYLTPGEEGRAMMITMISETLRMSAVEATGSFPLQQSRLV